MMEAVRTSEISVYHEITWRYIPEGSHLLYSSFIKMRQVVRTEVREQAL
jgi:hypothetical protein